MSIKSSLYSDLRALKQLLTKHSSDDNRSSIVAKNITFSLVIKGGSILSNFLLVPLTLGILDPTKYGIWITLSSIIGWFSFFDIGLSNGLRKFYTEAKVGGNIKLAREYVSTTFTLLLIILLIIDILFFIFSRFIDWTMILNCDKNMRGELSILASVVFYAFSFKFIANIISQLLIADLKTALNDFLNFLGNFLTLGFILFLKFTHKGDLLSMGLTYSIIPVIVFLVATIYLFQTRYKDVRPAFSHIDTAHIQKLFNLGFKYFFLQITAIILLTSQNLIIAQLFGPAEVTPYNIAYKYFSLIFVVYSIIISPLLPAYTQAYFSKDLDWIKRITGKFLQICYLFFFLIVIMIVFSNTFFVLWVGKTVSIPFILTLFIGLLNMMHIWNSLYLPLINGIGKIQIQLIGSVFTVILLIPLSIVLCKYTPLGISGVVLAQFLLLIPGLWLNKVQFNHLANNTARGIWNR
ncbi:MAG: MATE family efflux transporter [Bacteroidetes bacterium]|nr:MATE family efflux transporter [Bacteroidota bacterium]